MPEPAPKPTAAPGDAPLVIYGAGGHGGVVADAARRAGWQVLGFLDDRAAHARLDTASADTPLLDPNDPRLVGAVFIPAIGDNAARRAVFDKVDKLGWPVVNVLHPDASISPTAELGRGIFVGPGACVTAYARLGDGCLVNTNAVVEHHCELGGFVHVAPGCVLGGQVRVGSGSLLGLGCRVLPAIRLGENVTIGAGAVVTKAAADTTTLVGVPAAPRN